MENGALAEWDASRDGWGGGGGGGLAASGGVVRSGALDGVFWREEREERPAGVATHTHTPTHTHFHIHKHTHSFPGKLQC